MYYFQKKRERKEDGRKKSNIYFMTLKKRLVLGVFRIEKIHDDDNDNRIEGREGGNRN